MLSGVASEESTVTLSSVAVKARAKAFLHLLQTNDSVVPQMDVSTSGIVKPEYFSKFSRATAKEV